MEMRNRWLQKPLTIIALCGSESIVQETFARILALVLEFLLHLRREKGCFHTVLCRGVLTRVYSLP